MTTNEDEEEEDDCIEINDNYIGNTMRCRLCDNSIFSIYRTIVNPGNHFTEVALCCECNSSTIVTHLKQSYNDSHKLQLLDSDLEYLDYVLDLHRGAMQDVINDQKETDEEYKENCRSSSSRHH